VKILNKITTPLKDIIFILLLLSISTLLTQIFKDKAENYISCFFPEEPQDTCDIIFLGSSQMVCGANSLELWHNYHITSYNFATTGTSIPQSYYEAKYAIKKQHPKCIVLDLGFLLFPRKIDELPRLHRFLDNINDIKIKTDTITHLIDKKNWLEFLYPLYLYHSRWISLKKNDFYQGIEYKILKGAGITLETSTAPQSLGFTKVVPPYQNIPEINVHYLDKFIELCKKHDIVLVLVAIPTKTGVINNDFYSRAVTYLEKKYASQNVHIYNGYAGNNWDLDYHTDFSDFTHVNFRGAYKITDYIAQLLEPLVKKRNYNKKLADSWDADYNSYIKIFDNNYKWISVPWYTLGTNMCITSLQKIHILNDYYYFDPKAGDFFVNGFEGWQDKSASNKTLGKQSDAFFNLDSSKITEGLHLYIDISDIVFSKNNRQEMIVMLNDKNLGIYIFKNQKRGIINVEIPPNLLKAQNNHLCLKYPLIMSDDLINQIFEIKSITIK
jgi:hypothetical protein